MLSLPSTCPCSGNDWIASLDVKSLDWAGLHLDSARKVLLTARQSTSTGPEIEHISVDLHSVELSARRNKNRGNHVEDAATCNRAPKPVAKRMEQR